MANDGFNTTNEEMSEINQLDNGGNPSITFSSKIRPELQTLYQQIGHKAFYMMGAKDITYDNKNLALSWKMGGGSKWRYVEVQYDIAADLYHLHFVNYKGHEITKEHNIERVEASDLHRIIEAQTGMRLSLFQQGGKPKSGNMETKAIQWKKVGKKQWEGDNGTFDFAITEAKDGVTMDIFRSGIEDPDEAYVDSIEFGSVEAAKEDAAKSEYLDGGTLLVGLAATAGVAALALNAMDNEETPSRNKRPLSALARDRKYTSQQEWEKAYTKNRKSKIMTYNTKEEGGTPINKYNTKITIEDWSKQVGHKQYRIGTWGKIEDVGDGSVWTPRNDVPIITIDDAKNKKDAYQKAVVILEKEHGVKIDPVFTPSIFLFNQGGRPKSAIMRDRYNTNASEPWEANRERKTKARNRGTGGRALSQQEQDEAYVKGNLVFAKNEGQRGLVGLVVSEHPTKLAQHNEVDVYFRGYMGETLTMDTNEIEPVENGHLGFAENNGDLMHYPAIAKKLGFELNPKYQQMNDEYNNPEHGFTDEDDFARGGRTKSALMRDRYNTNASEPWEVNYAKKRITRARNRVDGGKAGKTRYWVGIPKEPEKVWDAWTKGQREHFIEDHFNSDSYRNSNETKHHYYDSLIKFISKNFAEIPDVPVKSALEAAIYNHIQHPQYNYGGEVDEFEETETFEPDWENDDFIEDKPRGGYDTSHAGKFLGNFESVEDALEALSEKHNDPKNNYFPTIWFVSDHGNYWAIDENGNEIKAAGGAIGGGVVPFFQSIYLSKLPPNIRSVVEPVAHHKEIIYVREGDSSFEEEGEQSNE
jgi:hypothetical protein